ncbi:MAG: hypothetical protein ACPGSO_00675 [Vicingaceae bacterium]
MLNFVKTLSSEIDSKARRVIKFLRLGKRDVQTSLEAMPFGVDSVPVKNLVAVYAPTSEKGQTVIIGYINKNAIADVGEFRAYSTNSDGEEQNYIWIKNDGTIEIGGDSDNMVRYSQIEASVNELKNDINDLKNIFSAWVTAPNDGGAALKTALAAYYTTPIVQDITGAKINEIKTS